MQLSRFRILFPSLWSLFWQLSFSYIIIPLSGFCKAHYGKLMTPCGELSHPAAELPLAGATATLEEVLMLSIMLHVMEYPWGSPLCVHPTSSKAEDYSWERQSKKREKALVLCQQCSTITKTLVSYQHLFANSKHSTMLVGMIKINSISAESSILLLTGIELLSIISPISFKILSKHIVKNLKNLGLKSLLFISKWRKKQSLI